MRDELMSEPFIENHAICLKLSEVSKSAEMESQLLKKNEPTTAGSIKTISSIAIEEDNLM